MNFTNTFKLFGLGAALVIGAVSLWTDVVWAQEQIAIYRVQPVQATRDSVLQLAREAFGMSSPQVTEDGVTFVLEQEQKQLTVWKASGAILFGDDRKLWNPEYEITSPTDPESAIQLALQFLKSQNLLPPQAVTEGLFMPIARVHYVKRVDGQEVANHWSVEFTLLVDSGTDLDLSPIDKARLLLRLGQNGEVIGLDHHWRGLGEQQLAAGVTFAQARELLAWKLGLPIEQIPPVDAARPLYVLHYAEEPQGWLYPVYGLSLVDPERGWLGGGIVPASKFSVLARIVSPKPEARFKRGDFIELRAQVREGFGSPPYRYAWYSVKDGQISQAGTVRVRLSPGLHQLWLYVTDRNETQDSQTLFIYVEELSGSAVGQSSLPAWLAIVLLSALGLIGVFRQPGNRLRGLGLILLVVGGLGLMTPASQAGRFPPCTDQGNDSDCSLFNNKMKFRLSLTATDGLALSNFRWKTHLVYSAVNSLLFPYLELEFTGRAQPLKVELDATQKAKYSAKELQRGCSWEFQVEYDPVSLPQVTKAGTPAGQEVQLKVTQSHVFYNSARGCPAAPEFYPQLRYELVNLANIADGMSFQKIRVFLRADFDVEGTKQEQGLKTGQELRDVAVMVREYILTPRFMEALLGPDLGFGLLPFCYFDAQQNQIQPRILQVDGERAVVICREKEFGTPTEQIEDFDNYHQADFLLWVPGCSIQTLVKGLPCVHLHQTIGYVTGDRALPGGTEAGSGWMPQVKIKQKLYAVQYNAGEVDSDPGNLTNNQRLTDIVMWWVFEADHSDPNAKPEGIFFRHDKRKFPWLYGAFSCGIVPLPSPTPYCP